MRLSALIVYNNDIDMLKLQMSSKQFELYDEIYICDGSYKYMTDRPLIDSMIYRLDETEFGKSLLKNEKIKYAYGLWESEREKRIYSYNWVQSDYVVLHDTDEFYEYDIERLKNFMESGKAVGSFYCQNLFLDGVYFSNEFYSVDDPLRLPHKNFVFKKELVSAEEHLNYLWLVGVDQLPPDPEKVYKPPVAFGYHLTQMRNDDGQRNKYYFYTSLHSSRSAELDSLVSLSTDVDSGLISRLEALDIYLRSIPEFLRVPSLSSNYIPRKRLKVHPKLEEVVRKAVDDQKITHAANFIIRSEMPCFLYFKAGQIPSGIEFDELADVRVQIIEYRYLKNSELADFGYGEVNKISIPASNLDVFGVLVKILAKSYSKYFKGSVLYGQ